MPTVRMPLPVAKDMAKALLPHIDKDVFGLALTGAIIGGETSQFAYATDRYTVAQYDLTNHMEARSDRAVHVPRPVLQTISTLGPAVLLFDPTDYWVSIQTTGNLMEATRENHPHVTYLDVEYVTSAVPENGETRESHFSRTFWAPGAGMPFPPVERFFNEFVPGEESRAVLSEQVVHKIAAYAGRRSHNAIRVTLGKRPDNGKAANYLIESGTRLKVIAVEMTTVHPDAFGNDIALMNQAKREHQDPDPSQSADATDRREEQAKEANEQ